MTRIIEIPNSRNVCDSCKYDHERTPRASYKIQFNSGDELNICFSCFDELHRHLMAKAAE